MNIGIDIDDTITNSSKVFVKYAKIYNKKHQIKYKINNSVLDKEKAFGWTEINQKEFASQYLNLILTKAKPNKRSSKVIKKLRQRNCKIYLITARSDSEIENMYEFTKKWLDKNKIEFDKLIINCNDKLSECIANNIDIFIDDNYFNCKNIYLNKKIPVLMYETNYNKNYDEINFYKVKNWKKIFEIISDKL